MKRAKSSRPGPRKSDAPEAKTPSLIRERQRKSDRLLETIRELAVQQQQDAPQEFLSLRAAAKRFKVPISAMATVYRQLAGEGLLSTVRGSRTLLSGRSSGRTLKVRGLIGIPISLRRFLTMRDYRYCFLHTRDELYARGFVTNCMFFEEEKVDPDLVIARLSKALVDAVIWLLPDGADRETGPRLRDRGIHFIGVNLAESSGVACRYEVRRRNAIRAVLRDWQSDPKIQGATIVRVQDENVAHEKAVEGLQQLAKAEQIDCQIVSVPAGGFSKFLKSLCTSRGNGILLPAPAAPLLAWHAPDELSDLLSACRVALMDGPMDLPHVGDAEVDLVTTRWAPIAKRIADDALSGTALSQGAPTVFEAAAHLRVSLQEVAHDL